MPADPEAKLEVSSKRVWYINRDSVQHRALIVESNCLARCSWYASNHLNGWADQLLLSSLAGMLHKYERAEIKIFAQQNSVKARNLFQESQNVHKFRHSTFFNLFPCFSVRFPRFSVRFPRFSVLVFLRTVDQSNSLVKFQVASKTLLEIPWDLQ